MTLVAALSDLHLGDEASVANPLEQIPPRVAQARITLPDAPASDAPERVRARIAAALDEAGGPLVLVLHGDVFDLSNASLAAVWRQARPFFARLLDGLPRARIVFVPGNHDHHLWAMTADARAARALARADHGPPGRDADPFFVRTPFAGWPLDVLEPAGELLRAAFPPDRDDEHVVAYPVYRHDVATRTLLFTHGHHFDQTSSGPGRLLAKATTLEELEAFTTGWVELMFYGLKQAGRFTQLAQKVYVELTRARRGWRARRATPDVAPGDGLEDVGPRLARMLELMHAAEELPMSFETVFGHTHRYLDGAAGPTGLVFNTGGWLATHRNAERQTRLLLADETRTRCELVELPAARFERARALDEAWRTTTRLAVHAGPGENDGSAGVAG